MHSTRDICRRCRWPRRLMTPRDCSLRFNQGEGCIPNQVSGRTCGRSNMKIAQIAPLAESIPPKLYGGTERIVSYLTEELVSQKHDVTLFASADSRTKARLAPACESALRLSSRAIIDPFVHYVRLLELVFPASTRIRHLAFPYRLPAFSANEAAIDTRRNDAPRKADDP